MSVIVNVNINDHVHVHADANVNFEIFGAMMVLLRTLMNTLLNQRLLLGQK